MPSGSNAKHGRCPHIVAIYDFGQTSGLFYFVMEFVDGANLRQMIRNGTLTSQEALAVVPQICEALQFAHDEGIVHQDIKPENILIDKRGRVKIADFGLAKLLGQDASDHSLTATHQVMGTLRYMAPEQMQGSRAVDHRADIYSLGVVFYELLTGELPMGGFAPPSKKVQVDVRLDEIVLRALEQEPEQRYQHASEVKTDVDAISHSPSVSRPVSAKVEVMPTHPEGTPFADTGRATLPTVSPQIRHQLKGPAIALMLYGLVVLFPALLCFTNGFDIADGNDATPTAVGFGMIAFSFLLLGLVGLIIRGGWHMLALESYHAAFLASFLGQPIGMWGLLVLSRPDVKSAFSSVSRERAGTVPASTHGAAPPDRPALVLVFAALDLIAAVLLILACTAGDHVAVSATESWLWHAWGVSEIMLGLLGSAGLLTASLWKPWARKLMLGVCFFGLAALVIDLPYLAHVVIPTAFEEHRQAEIAKGFNTEDADRVARLGVTIGFGGLFVVGLSWLIGHLVYFNRPRVVAVFELQRQKPGKFIEWLFTGAGAVVGLLSVFGPLALLFALATYFSPSIDRTTGRLTVEVDDSSLRVEIFRTGEPKSKVHLPASLNQRRFDQRVPQGHYNVVGYRGDSATHHARIDIAPGQARSARLTLDDVYLDGEGGLQRRSSTTDSRKK